MAIKTPSWLKDPRNEVNTPDYEWDYEGYKQEKANYKPDFSTQILPQNEFRKQKNFNDYQDSFTSIASPETTKYSLSDWKGLGFLDKAKAVMNSWKDDNVIPYEDIQKQETEKRAKSPVGAVLTGFENSSSLGSFGVGAKKQQQYADLINQNDNSNIPTVFEKAKEEHPFLYGTGEFAGYALPASAGAKLAKPLTKNIANPLLNRLAEGALVGGGMTAAQDTIEGKPINETVFDTALNSVLGSGIDLGLYGISKVIPKAFPKWKTTFESGTELNTEPKSMLDDLKIKDIAPGDKVTFKDKPFTAGEKNIDGQISLLNTEGKPVLSTLPENLNVDLNATNIEPIKSEFKPGKKVLFENKEYVLGEKNADGNYNLLNRSNKPVLTATEQDLTLKPSTIRELRAEKNKLIRDYVDFIDTGKIDQAESLNSRIATIDDILGEKSPLPDSVIAKDKSKIAINRETFDRNLEDVFKNDSDTFKGLYSDPIKASEAESIRFKNNLRDEVKNLKLTNKESELVQKYGEGKLSINELENMKGVDWQKVKNASEYFKKTYKNLLNTANEVLTRNGYKPIAEKPDYFPHFEELNPIMKALGIQNPELPTDINGLTSEFSPGKTFFNSALHRKGDKTVFDAVRGFDNYIEGISNIIHHTDNIQRIRSLERDVRTVYKDKTELTNFVAYLHEYGNTLAGKKSAMDRGFEDMFGRPVYKFFDFVRKQTGANMVGANISSALTNFVPLTQAISTTSKKDFAKGLGEAFKNSIPGLDDGFYKKSDFLTRRFGSDKLFRTNIQKFSDTANWVFKIVDKFVSETIVRSKYYENLKKGIPDNLAIKDADTWAARIMADRSLGQIPQYFNSKVVSSVFQFQLEVNNQISYLFKDLPKEKLKGGINKNSVAALANTATQIAIYSYLFNNIYEKATGRRPAFDVLGVAEQAYNDYKGKELPLTTALNKIPVIKYATNPTPKITEPLKNDKATSNLIENIKNQLPFISTITGGRMPISSGLPSLKKIATGESTAIDEFKNPLYYFLLPTGGGQIKKTIDGLSVINSQGSYNKSKTQLNYPIDNNTSNTVKAALFGKSSLPETQEFYANDRKPLSEEQTKLLRAAIGLDTPTKKLEKQIKDEKLDGKSSQEIYSKILDERAINKIKDELYNYKKDLEENDLIDKTSSKYIQEDVNTIIKNSKLSKDDKIKKLQSILQQMKNKY